MDQKTDRLYPSAPVENIDLERRKEKNWMMLRFNRHISNIKKIIAYFNDKNHKSKKNKKYKTLTTILKSTDTIVIIATTSSFITLSLTGIGLTATACGSWISNKVVYEININKYNKYTRQYERDQQSIKSFDKLHRKSLQDNVIDKNEYESLCNIFTKHLDETKNESFL